MFLQDFVLLFGIYMKCTMFWNKTFSENLFEVNVLPRPKNSWNLQKSILHNFFIIFMQIELAKAIFN